jgi:hypothetical protein
VVNLILTLNSLGLALMLNRINYSRWKLGYLIETFTYFAARLIASRAHSGPLRLTDWCLSNKYQRHYARSHSRPWRFLILSLKFLPYSTFFYSLRPMRDDVGLDDVWYNF